jgi:anti-sigma factor RsiW
MTPRHEEARRMLPLLVAQALPPPDERILRQHLSDCEQCREELAAMEAIAGAISRLPMPATPKGLAARAKARVRARRAAASEERVSAAIVLFAILFGWTMTLLPWMLTLWAGGTVTVLGIRFNNPVMLLGASTLLAWITGGVTVLMLLIHPRGQWRMS